MDTLWLTISLPCVGFTRNCHLLTVKKVSVTVQCVRVLCDICYVVWHFSMSLFIYELVFDASGMNPTILSVNHRSSTNILLLSQMCGNRVPLVLFNRFSRVHTGQSLTLFSLSVNESFL